MKRKNFTWTWAHHDKVNGSKNGIVFQFRIFRFMLTARIEIGVVCSIGFAFIWRYADER